MLVQYINLLCYTPIMDIIAHMGEDHSNDMAHGASNGDTGILLLITLLFIVFVGIILLFTNKK